MCVESTSEGHILTSWPSYCAIFSSAKKIKNIEQIDTMTHMGKESKQWFVRCVGWCYRGARILASLYLRPDTSWLIPDIFIWVLDLPLECAGDVRRLLGPLIIRGNRR